MYTFPFVSHAGCSGRHASPSVSWTGCRTPPRDKSMTYTVAWPVDDDLDLSAFCNQMHPSLPKQSCVVGVEREINGQRVRACSLLCVLRVYTGFVEAQWL
jgi:hypothetical protein